MYATGFNAASVVGCLVASNTLVEQNEKSINDIFFSTLAKHNFAFTELQKAAITDIAHQCPYTGGEAVYRARVLHTTLTGLIDFDDSTSCAIQGINWRHSNPPKVEKSITVSVIPNPTNGNAAFVFSISIESNCDIEIFNSLGQKISTFSVPKNTDIWKFDTDAFAKGLYYFKVNGLNKALSGKFIVEK